MNKESLLTRLQQLDAQEEILHKERRKIINQLAGDVSTSPKRKVLSETELAMIRNKRLRNLTRAKL